ncbi:hypothetical protein HZC09_01175 [Candidatus Micrarchaeota archaeon]|nr:hypothetical protein [Candidatus Micrarchaeota archaeon]
METRIADYPPATTEPSRRELLNIARWLQENRRTAYLVGGWAVYYYTKPGARPHGKVEVAAVENRFEDPYGFQALGSKDIDLVFKNKRDREEFEQEYCRKNSYYKPRIPEPRQLVKHAENVEILLDTDLLSNSWKVGKTRFEWKILEGRSANLELEAGLSVLAPKKELLLLLKCVALVERTGRRRQPNQDLRYLDSKIWKDANDVLALHDTGVNAERLSSLAKETGLAGILSEAKQILAANYENYGFSQYASGRKFVETE